MKTKKWIAALLALCMTTFGALGATAESKLDALGSLIGALLGQSETSEDAESYDDDLDYLYDDEEPIEVNEHIEVTDLSVTQGLSDDWTNLLLLGTDARGDTKYLRTDTMIVLSVNHKTSQAKMTSIMRDIWVQIPGYDGQKLNAACVYGGPELTMRMINEYFGMNIEKYVLVNMKCLVAIVDALGGVELDITPSESAAIGRLNASSVGASDGSGKYVSSGVPSGSQVTLDGRQVLAYSRIRKSDSDYARTGRQRTVLLAIARKLQDQGALALTGIVASLLQYVETNLSLDEILDIAAVCMSTDLDSIGEFRIPADGTYQDGMFGNTWCIKPDFEANARALHEFIYG